MLQSRPPPPPSSSPSFRSRSPSLSCRGLGPASLTPRNILEMTRAFLFGLRDSLLGLVHVFHLDGRAERRRARRAIRDETRKEMLLGGRDSPRLAAEEEEKEKSSPDTLAKRRALEKREKEKKKSVTSSSSSSHRSSSSRSVEVDSPPHIKERILLCCALNGAVFYIAKQFFVQVVLPLIRAIYLLAASSAAAFAASSSSSSAGSDGGSGVDASSAADVFWADRVEPSLNFFKSAALTMPLFVLCKVVNAVLYQEIADSAFRQSRGRVRMMSSLSVMVSDVIISILVELLFLAQGTACAFLPIPGVSRALSFFHLSLLYSLYSFEYKWYNQGIGLHQRLNNIENNWPYFLGFGMPLTLLTEACSDYITAGCTFSLLFPLYIVAGNQAHVVMNAENVTVYVFYPTISASNFLFDVFRRFMQRRKVAGGKQQHQQQQNAGRAPSFPRQRQQLHKSQYHQDAGGIVRQRPPTTHEFMDSL